MFKKIVISGFLMIIACSPQAFSQPGVDIVKSRIDSLYRLEQTPQRDSLLATRLLYLLTTESPINDSTIKIKAEVYKKFVKESIYPQAQAYNDVMLGYLYNRVGYYTLAATNLEKAIKKFSDFKNDVMYFHSYSTYSGLVSLQILNNPEKETEARNRFYDYTLEQMKTAYKLKDSLMISTYQLNLGLNELAKKNYQKAREHYRKSWQTVAHQPNQFWFAYYGGRWAEGLCLIHMGQKNAGFKLINEAIAATELMEPNEMNGLAKINLRYIIGFLLGEYYIKKGDYQLALTETNIAQKQQDLMQIAIYSHFLNKNYYRIYRALGKDKLALDYFEKVTAFNENLENEQTKERYTIWANEQENIQKDNRISVLEVDNLLQVTERQNMLRNALIIGLVLAGLLTLYILRSNRQLKKANASLTQKNKEIETALFKGQHLERKRVASELHDTLATKISALKWRLEAIEDGFTGENYGFIQNAIQSLEELYTDVRFISHNLLPEELERKGLKISLASLIEKLNRLNKTNFHLVFDGIDQPLEQAVQYEFYNVVLELCHNILKHAQAQNAYISISEIDQRLFLTVKDDGVGMDKTEKAKGIGQANIRNRIAALGGEIEISSDNSGTEIIVTV